MNIKLKNLYKAGISTIIGIMIGAITAGATVLATGSLDKKALIAGIVPVVALGLTDFLKEVQKSIGEDDAKEAA